MTGTTNRSSQQLPVEPGGGDDPPRRYLRTPRPTLPQCSTSGGLHFEAPLQPASISYRDWPAR